MSDEQDEQEWSMSDEDWAKKPRVFVAPVIAYQHEKDSDTGALPHAGVLVNRKRFTPNPIRRWEGKIGLFGGAVAPGELRRVAIQRELGEELPGVGPRIALDGKPERLGAHAAWVFGGSYPRDAMGKWDSFTESDFREIAGVCQEGAADVLFAPEIEAMSPEAFTYPELRVYLLDLLADAQDEIALGWGAEV